MVESTSMKELYETLKSQGQKFLNTGERMAKLESGIHEIHHTLTNISQSMEYLLKKSNDMRNGSNGERTEGSGNAGNRQETYTPPHLRNMGNQQGITSITYKMEFPEFNGVNPLNWIREANRFFELNPNENRKVLHAGYYMVGVADTWYTEYVEGQPGIDWETFCEMLLQRFIAPRGKDISAGVSNEENIEVLNVSGVDGAEPAKDGSLIKPSQLPIVHSSRGTSLKNNVAKVSTVGKLHILKPKRAKNGTTPFVKDNILNPTNVSSEGVTALSNPVPERKHVLTVLKKRPTPQALSRNDFFNQIRKKSMNSFSASDLSISNSSSGPGKITEMEAVVYDDEPAEEILQILDKEEFDFLFMSRQLYAAEFRDADKIIDSSSVSCDAFERLKEHWYVTTFSKDLFHVELSEHQHFIDRIEFLESQDARRSSREFLYEILGKVIKAGTTTLNIHEFPNKEMVLKDGNLVSFGTGNANYRFRFVAFMFFVCSSNAKLQDTVLLMGGCCTRSWSLQCTHCVVDDMVSVNDGIIDAILAKKPVIKFTWIELFAGKAVWTEFPGFGLHTPTLTLEGLRVKVCEPETRENCLEGYTFLLESEKMYRFKNKLQLILETGGAKVVYVEATNSQSMENRLVCVVPAGMNSSSKSNNLPKVKETELVSAVVSGHLDPSIIASPPVLVTSSCSTDETIVPESDVEMETAISVNRSLEVHILNSDEDECEEKIEIEDAKFVETEPVAVHAIESPKQDTSGNANDPRSDYSYSTVKSDEFVAQKNMIHASESENVDILYSQDLIVREYRLSEPGLGSVDGSVVNFKRFRKNNVPSGNSFRDLIPFAKDPYRASDYGNEDVAESIKEEKRRKQMEAIADDLFNNVKGKKRGASGLHGIFVRG